MKTIFACLILGFALLVGPVKAEEAAVKATISAQLDAFRAGDADAAYALAAPSIKRMFPTPDRFIRMVRQGYRPVYDARMPVFLRAQSIDGDRFAQEVGFTDGSGQGWTALYTLSKQNDGAWLITGCYLRKSDGQNI